MTDRGLDALEQALEATEEIVNNELRAVAVLGEKGVYTTDGTVFAEGIEKIVESERDLRASFDLRWKADMRAIKRWQAAHPERPNVELTWPDHADLVVWLLGEVERLEQGLKIMQENFPKTIPAPMDRP